MSSLPMISTVPVRWALATAWVLALGFSLYGADEVVLWLRTSSWAGEDPRALALAEALARAGRASRLSALHDVLEGGLRRGSLHRPRRARRRPRRWQARPGPGW